MPHLHLSSRIASRKWQTVAWALTIAICIVYLLCESNLTVAHGQGAIDPRFGAIEAFWAPDEASELGIGWERILFYWRELQPSGPDDWNTLHVLEEWLVSANTRGRTVVGLIKNTPPWASENGTEAGLPKGLYLAVDDPANLWARFLSKVASYYGPRGVHHWIIWNEPEIKEGVYGYEFAGSVEDYFQMLKVAYLVMKRVDPVAVIHLAGLTWWHDPGYLRRLLDVATSDPEASEYNAFFDIISLHIYFRSETVQTIVRDVLALQNEYGLEKPIWINETNAAPNRDPLWPVERPVFSVDLDQQAWYIVQAFALGFGTGATRIGVYKLIDVQLPPGGESFGILRPDFSRRPAFEAYRTTIRYLKGYKKASTQQAPNFFVVTFNRPASVTHVAWARRASPVTLQITARSDSAVLSTALGQTFHLFPEEGNYLVRLDGARCETECIIGGPPVFIEEEIRGGHQEKPALAQEVSAEIVSRLIPVPPTTTPTVTLTPSLTATATPTPSPSSTPTPFASPTPSPTLTSLAQSAPNPNSEVGRPFQEIPGEATEVTWFNLSEQVGLIFLGLALILGIAVAVVVRRVESR